MIPRPGRRTLLAVLAATSVARCAASLPREAERAAEEAADVAPLIADLVRIHAAIERTTEVVQALLRRPLPQ